VEVPFKSFSACWVQQRSLPSLGNFMIIFILNKWNSFCNHLPVGKKQESNSQTSRPCSCCWNPINCSNSSKLTRLNVLQYTKYVPRILNEKHQRESEILQHFFFTSFLEIFVTIFVIFNKTAHVWSIYLNNFEGHCKVC